MLILNIALIFEFNAFLIMSLMITSNYHEPVQRLMKNPDDEHHNVIDELTNALQSYNAKTEKEKEKVKDPELRKIIDLQNESIAKLREDISYFKLNSKEMEDQLEVLQEEYNELQKSMDIANEEIDSLKEESSNLEKDTASHMKKEMGMEEEITLLKEKISELEKNLAEKAEQLETQVVEETNTENDDEVNVAEMKFNYEIKISALENKLSELKSQISSQDQGNKQITVLESEVKERDLKIKEERALFEKREKENKELREQIDKMKSDHDKQVKSLETKIESLNSEIDQLRSKEKKVEAIVTPSATPTEKFSKAKLQEIIDSSKLAQNILNILEKNREIKLKFLAMQLGTSQKKCMDELKKLENINYIGIEFAKPGDKNPNIKIIKNGS